VKNLQLCFNCGIRRRVCVLSNAKVCVITVVCNLRRIVEINFLVKSEEPTFIVVALPSKTRDNIKNYMYKR
jgi:hypothetical protein